MSGTLTRPPVDVFIRNFKRGFDEKALIRAFTEGCCYHFAAILKDAYPEGEILYSQRLGHFYFDLGCRAYDITGEIYGLQHSVSWERLPNTDPALYMRLLRDCVYRINYFPGISNEYYNPAGDDPC